MSNSTITEAVARAKDTEGEWGARLREYLDAAGVTEAERIEAVRERIEDARELLACCDLPGNAHFVGAGLDSIFEAADALCVGLEEDES